jgi:hypothetical protein
MNSKFVLESFEAYLGLVGEQVNEAKSDFTPTIDFVKGFVTSLLEKQKELGKKSESFKKFADKEDPYEAWLTEWKGRKSNTGKNWPGKGGARSPKFYGSFAAPYLWPKLSDDQKNQVYEDFLKLIKKSGYEKESQINKLVSNKEQIFLDPYISITPSFVELPPTEKKTPVPFTIVGLEEGQEGKLFKDNRWGSGIDSASGKVNPDAFRDLSSLEDIKKTIGDFVKKYADGEVSEITSIQIESSASRYRNTNEKGGKAENLSWGELSYNRAITIVGLFKEAAEENNLSDDKKEELRSKITIDSKGRNGDGTSGPNPPVGARFGYYDEKSKFIENNGTFSKGKDETQNRKLKVIAELGEGGKPTGKYTTQEEDPKAGPVDYDQFRYVNFTIIGNAIVGGEIINVVEVPGSKVTLTPAIGFPKKDQGGSFTRTTKKKGKRVGSPGAGGNPFQCPEF